MSVINFNTAKPLRKGDNGEYLVLCPTHFPAKVCSISASDYRLDSEFLYKTSPLGIVRGGACAVRAHTDRKPLRLIVARTPVTEPYRPNLNYFLTHYIDTLSCGHQVITYKFEEFKKRRGCQLCLDGLQISVSGKVAA